jgi:hypothetical protein
MALNLTSRPRSAVCPFMALLGLDAMSGFLPLLGE